MTTKYTYTISTQTANGKVQPGKLHAEIVEASLPGFIGVRPGGADQEIMEFSVALSAEDKTTLDGIVAAHTGTYTTYVFHVSSGMLDGEKSVTAESSFEEVGSRLASPDFFVTDLTTVLGRILCQVKVNGNGAEIQVVEEPDESLSQSGEVVVASASAPDNAGVWKDLAFYTSTVCRAGRHRYRLEAKKNGATSFDIRAAGLTLLERVVVEGSS